MWLDKFLKKGGKTNPQAPKEEAVDEKGLNEEMVSVSRDLEPKESDGFAKIFETTEKEEPENAEGVKEEAEKIEENK